MLIGLSHGWVAAQTLNLVQLIQLAIDTHPSVRAQLSNEKSAQSGIETAQYQRYPTPQLSYESVKKNSADPSYIGSDGVARWSAKAWRGTHANCASGGRFATRGQSSPI